MAALEETALAAGHEGVVLNSPDSAYTPGRRGRDWLTAVTASHYRIDRTPSCGRTGKQLQQSL